ncbi:MAG: Fic family protein [Chloroflexi bacterium]|nr:Fic family protein [Chloroflexota bacterium]
MDLISKELQEDYERWKNEIGEDPYVSHKTMGILDVLRAHYLIIDFFAHEREEGVGGVGPKNLNLLHSTLSRQFSGYQNKEKWNTDLEICASLFWGLVKNHAFHDVNKRTAILSLFYHLLKLKRFPHRPHKLYEQLAICVASNSLENYPVYEKYKDKHDAEVLFIADFLSHNTRKMEKTEYKITFRQLDNILRKYEFGLAYSDNNKIDIVKYYDEKVGLLGRKIIQREQRIASIGFPGWTRQVNLTTVKQIRRLTGLTVENGYDSETFYHDADSLPFLINEFQGLLIRLADK